MVGDGDERAPPDAPELKRRRKSPRLAEAAEREAEPEHGSGGAPEGERRGGCERGRVELEPPRGSRSPHACVVAGGELGVLSPERLTRPPIRACRAAGECGLPAVPHNAPCRRPRHRAAGRGFRSLPVVPPELPGSFHRGEGSP